jgi:hypothetical protein
MSFSLRKAAQAFSRGQIADWPRPSVLALPNFSLELFQAGPRLTALLCSFLLTFLLTSLSYGEILIEPRVGFHGVFQLGRPFPLELEVSNSGRPADGFVEVQVWKGGAAKSGVPYPLYYRRDLFVSGQSRKTIQLTVDPDFISRPLVISFISPAGSASRELDLRRYFSPSPLMLVVSEASSLSISLGSALPHRLVAVSLSELPSDPRALLGVSHLFVYDQSLRELSRAQLFALESWLTAGGRMVIIGSLNYALYQETSLSRFLPVRVTGSQRISFSPQTIEDEPATPIAGVWAQVSSLLDGKVLLESAGIPLLVERSRGKGRITYFALDLGRAPLAQWEGLPKLLRKLVAPAGEDVLPPRTRWDDAIFSQIIVSPSFISTYVPTRSLLLGIIGYFAALGMLALLWQKSRLPARKLVVGLGIVVALAATAGYPLFSRGGNVPDGVLLSSTMLDNVADGYVEAQLNMAMFSTQIRQYNLQLAPGWLDMSPVSIPTKDRSQEAVLLQDGSGSSRFRLPLREWDYRLFRMRFIDRFPMRAEFEIQGDQLLMKIDNQSSKDLVDCWLALPGGRHSLGEIARGSRWSRVFPLNAAAAPEANQSSRGDAVNLRDLSFKDKTRDILFHSSFFPRDGDASRWNTGAAIFFGWVKDSERRVSVDDPRIHARDYTLFRAIIPLPGPEDE